MDPCQHGLVKTDVLWGKELQPTAVIFKVSCSVITVALQHKPQLSALKQYKFLGKGCHHFLYNHIKRTLARNGMPRVETLLNNLCLSCLSCQTQNTDTPTLTHSKALLGMSHSKTTLTAWNTIFLSLSLSLSLHLQLSSVVCSHTWNKYYRRIANRYHH